MPASPWNATPIGHGAADASSSQLAPPIDNRENADDSLSLSSVGTSGPDLWWENVDDSDFDDGSSNASAPVDNDTSWLQQGAAAVLTNLGSPCAGAALPGEDEAFEEEFGDWYSDADLAGIRKQSVFLRPSSSK